MKGLFPLFHSPLNLAHHFWKLILGPHDRAIDATCGNGYDTLFLARICKEVISLDIQEEALQSARARLKAEGLQNVHFLLRNHETFPKFEFPIKLIAYNLGYLPGGNKDLTTLTSTTVRSVQNGLALIEPGGMVSITCYPGHLEGAREEETLLAFSEGLEQSNYSVSHHSWKNRNKGPSLLLIQKKQLFQKYTQNT